MILHMHPEGRVRLAEGEGLAPIYDEDGATYAADATALGLPALTMPRGALEAWRADVRPVVMSASGMTEGRAAPQTIIRTANGRDVGAKAWKAADEAREHADQLVALAAARRAAATAAIAAAERDAIAQRKSMDQERAEDEISLAASEAANTADLARRRAAGLQRRQEAMAEQEALAKRRLPALSFRMRLSTARRQQITLAASRALDAGDATLQTFLDDLASAGEVELDRDDVQAGIAAMRAAGLLTDQEHTALVADSLQEERVNRT